MLFIFFISGNFKGKTIFIRNIISCTLEHANCLSRRHIYEFFFDVNRLDCNHLSYLKKRVQLLSEYKSNATCMCKMMNNLFFS